MSFITSLEKNTNRQSYTMNGALSNTSTLDPLLDFFSNAGAMRGREAEAVALFEKAFAADPTNAMRCLFYLRDIRGGQGERSVFRAIIENLDNELLLKVLKWVPLYGRWDEVPISTLTAPQLFEQFKQDETDMRAGESISLLAKWLPSENTSSRASRRAARLVATAWGLKPREYRQRLAALRGYLNIVERKMSAREWSSIEYEKLPTQAHRKHVGAFRRHDEARYEKYLESVEKGEAKINSNTAFTYEIYETVMTDWEGKHTRTANAMWQALPDYTNGQNALVLADVSGSMSGRPMAISVSLALYFAERNTGPFKDYFMTFTSTSRLQKVRGSNLYEKMKNLQNSEWGMSTNLQSAFNAILKAAKDSNASADEMPKTLYIISDMQFDHATGRNDETNFEAAERKFREAGYELPHVVFWNCNAYGDEAPATKYDNRVTLISGSSQSTFQYVVAGKTPLESMLDILGSERYAQIVL